MRFSPWLLSFLLLVIAPESAHAFGAAKAIRRIFPPYHHNTPPPPPLTAQCSGVGTESFHACYYAGIDLSGGVKATAEVSTVDFDWGQGSPDPRVPSDGFSASFEGDFTFEAASYLFTATGDDGVRLYVDGGRVIDAWLDQGPTAYTATQALSAGVHRIKLEYYEDQGGAVARLSWAKVNAHVDPMSVSEDALRNFRGDFGGIYVPEIVPQCPVDPRNDIHCNDSARGFLAGELFTAEYGVYTTDQRKAIRDAYTKGIGVDGKPRGYTHFPISVGCTSNRDYNNMFPPVACDRINGLLQELWDDGIYPVCFVLPDSQTTTDLSHLDKSLCRLVVPMWEMDGPLNGDTSRINEAVDFTRKQFPDSLLYIHFTPGHGAGGSPESEWWQWAVKDGADQWHSPPLPNPHATGFLFQSDTWDDVQATLDRLADFTSRLGAGMNGWPGGTDVVLFETDIYTKFWDGRTEAQGVDYNNQLLKYVSTPLCEGSYCGTLRGFNSGGTVR